MAVSRPVLTFGPRPSHVSDLVEQHKIGWHIPHGDVDAAEKAMREMLATPEAELRAMGDRAAKVVATSLSKKALCGEFTDLMVKGLPKPA
jgi:glycosyltransferase involved in cell wall biosynthesis